MAKKQKQNWEQVWSDDEFAQLFVGKTIAEVRAAFPSDDVAPYVEADLFWRLSDGGWIAMHLADQSVSGCDTCGYGRDEKAYYFLAPVGS